MFAPNTSVSMKNIWWINRKSSRILRSARKTGSQPWWNLKNWIKRDFSRSILGSRSRRRRGPMTINSSRIWLKNLYLLWNSMRRQHRRHLLLRTKLKAVHKMITFSSIKTIWQRGNSRRNLQGVVEALVVSAVMGELAVPQLWSGYPINTAQISSSAWPISLSERTKMRIKWCLTKLRMALCCPWSTQTILKVSRPQCHIWTCDRQLKVAAKDHLKQISSSLRGCCSWRRLWTTSDD